MWHVQDKPGTCEVGTALAKTRGTNQNDSFSWSKSGEPGGAEVLAAVHGASHRSLRKGSGGCPSSVPREII